MDALLSAAEASRAFGVPANVVRVWADRRRLHAAGLDRSGRPLYRRDHVATLVATYKPRTAPADR